MSSKAEVALRRLQRLKSNCVCANCGTEKKFGFSSVCIKFKTFVCDYCKSSHAAVSHRCKSVSMSSWSDAEVQSLTEAAGGGNNVARRTWLKHAPPIGTAGRPAKGMDLDVFKRFVVDVYDRRKYYGEDDHDMPSPPASGREGNRAPGEGGRGSGDEVAMAVPVRFNPDGTIAKSPPQSVETQNNDVFAQTSAAAKARKTRGRTVPKPAPAPTPAPAAPPVVDLLDFSSNAPVSAPPATPGFDAFAPVEQQKTIDAQPSLTAVSDSSSSSSSSSLSSGFQFLNQTTPTSSNMPNSASNDVRGSTHSFGDFDMFASSATTTNDNPPNPNPEPKRKVPIMSNVNQTGSSISMMSGMSGGMMMNPQQKQQMLMMQQQQQQRMMMMMQQQQQMQMMQQASQGGMGMGMGMGMMGNHGGNSMMMNNQGANVMMMGQSQMSAFPNSNQGTNKVAPYTKEKDPFASLF